MHNYVIAVYNTRNYLYITNTDYRIVLNKRMKRIVKLICIHFLSNALILIFSTSKLRSDRRRRDMNSRQPNSL
jgi:hypothetical protein